MYFKVLQPCTFSGVAYKVGDMIDIADKESIANLQRELGALVEVTTPEKMAQEKAEATKTPRPKPVPVSKEESKPVRKWP